VKRREFITVLSGAAAAWPLAAHAQQPDRKRRIGVLTVNTEGDPEYRASIAHFVQGLASLGWTEGRNIQIDHRYPVRPHPRPYGGRAGPSRLSSRRFPIRSARVSSRIWQDREAT
jgi:hypothetical protein